MPRAVLGVIEHLLDWIDRSLPLHETRPLAGIGSLKLKFTLVIGAAIAVSMGTAFIGIAAGLHPMWSVVIALAMTVVVVQILARGITAPLKDMQEAAGLIAAGEYDRRVAAPAAGQPTDEVGELARAFNAMAADIAEVNRQREQLIANVSHELRTPMAVLHGSVENLLDGVADDPQPTLEAMLKQTDRLRRLLDQLLDLSRMDAGVQRLRIASVDLVELIDDVVAATVPASSTARIAARVPASLEVAGDPARLYQVFANVIDNAHRHGARGPAGSADVGDPAVIIEVGMSVVGDHAVVVVADNGPGVPASQLEHIFGRFARVGEDRASRTGGAGLGLAIAAEIVDLHGGSIAAANRPTGGCEITVRLPCGVRPDAG